MSCSRLDLPSVAWIGARFELRAHTQQARHSSSRTFQRQASGSLPRLVDGRRVLMRDCIDGELDIHTGVADAWTGHAVFTPPYCANRLSSLPTSLVAVW